MQVANIVAGTGIDAGGVDNGQKSILPIVIGATAGAIIILIIVIAFLVISRRRKTKKNRVHNVHVPTEAVLEMDDFADMASPPLSPSRKHAKSMLGKDFIKITDIRNKVSDGMYTDDVILTNLTGHRCPGQLWNRFERNLEAYECCHKRIEGHQSRRQE